jgi:hypothetical protein
MHTILIAVSMLAVLAAAAYYAGGRELLEVLGS